MVPTEIIQGKNLQILIYPDQTAYKFLLNLRPKPQRDSTFSRHGFAYICPKERAIQAEFDGQLNAIMLMNRLDPIKGAVALFYLQTFKSPSHCTKKEIEEYQTGQRLRIQTPDVVNCMDFMDNRLKDRCMEDDRYVVYTSGIKRNRQNTNSTQIFIAPVATEKEICSFIKKEASWVEMY